MLASIPAIPRRYRNGRSVRAVAGVSRMAAMLTVAALLVAVPTAAQAAQVMQVTPATQVAPRCTTNPGTPITDVPWPQQHYDLTALGAQSTGAGLTVAVVDSGVDAAHPQLRDAVRTGSDMLVRGGDGREDCVGHGTAVASIIAGRSAAGTPFQGLAPGVTILPVRVSERTDIDGQAGQRGDAGDIGDLATGIRAAAASQPRPAVINLSISTTADDPAVRTAVREALAADIVVVAAAGNHHDRGNPRPYPASYDGVVGVGAITPDGHRLPASQVGSYVDIVAPGDRVVAAVPGAGHQTFQGTSLAVPFVAATAALIRARYPGLGQADVVRRLLATTDPAPGSRPSPEYGYGVLNPVRALTEVLTPTGPAAAPQQPLPADVNPAGDGLPAASTTLIAAAGLVIAAMVVATVAAAMPLGRRRRWQPGVVEDMPTLLTRATPLPPPEHGPAPPGGRHRAVPRA